jgi:hypothetical protein
MEDEVALDEVIRNPNALPPDQRLADLGAWMYESDTDRTPRPIVVDWTLNSGALKSVPATVGELRKQLSEGGFGFADGGQSVILVRWADLREGEADAYFKTPVCAVLLRRGERHQ